MERDNVALLLIEEAALLYHDEALAKVERDQAAWDEAEAITRAANERAQQT